MTPEPEKSYRVWVEQHREGWVVVTAPDAEIARDRAQTLANKDWWSPETAHASPRIVEEIHDVV